MTELPRHVEDSAIVLDDVKLVYVPVPKAGSTAMLWALLELVELERDDFTRSPKLEVTPSLTIHDTTIWGGKHGLRGRDARAIFDSDDWLTFTLVRDPLPRIWSAWVSKIMLRDPRFVAAYGDEEWFPKTPGSAEEIVEAFRRFVAVLVDLPSDLHDPHWSSQAELLGIGSLTYDVVGRIEDLPAALERVDAHLRAHGQDGLTPRRENPSLLSFVPEILDRDSWGHCAELTLRDRDVFGYRLPPLSTDDPHESWLAEADARIPAIHAVIERNERIGDLKRLVTRSRAS